MSGALGHITFWQARSDWCCVARNTFVFSKMFHLFSRDLSVKRKEIFVSVNWTLLLLYFGCPYIKLSISTKNALLQQDTAYIKRFCHDQMRIENRIKLWNERSSCISSNKGCSSPRSISISQLNTLLCLHLWPIKLVVYKWPYSFKMMGYLILRCVSRLDAFSVYHDRTRLPGYALGRTTDAPEVRPTRSSRTKVSSSQISNAHDR